jgi:hypothetical protein
MSYSSYKRYNRRGSRRKGYKYYDPGNGHQATSKPDLSRSFVRQHLFKFDSVNMQAFTGYYTERYGDNAGRYLTNTITQWAAGTVKMSAQTEQRILECVPKFMAIEEQFELLLLSAPILDRSTETTYNLYYGTKPPTIQGLHSCYTESIQDIRARTVHLLWFVKNVFTEQEIQEYVECLRYVAIQQLIKSYSAVLDDLRQILPALQISGCKVRYHYEEHLRMFRLDLFDIADLDAYKLLVQNPPPAFVSRIGIENAKMIMDRLLLIEHKLTQGTGSVMIGVNELKSFVQTILSSKNGPEYSASLVVNGSGGAMHIEISRKDPELLRKNLSMLTLLKYLTAALGLLVVWMLISHGHWLFAFIFGAGFTSAFSSLHLKTDYLQKELLDYE